MEFVVRGLLRAITGDALLEITLWIQKSHSNEGQTKIAGLFTVVAGKNAQATGVNRQRLVQTKLRRKVGDGSLGQSWIGTREPGLIGTRMHIDIKVFENIIVALQVVRLTSNLC